MQIMVKFDIASLTRELTHFLDHGVKPIFMKSKTVLLSQREAGVLTIEMFPPFLDALVEELHRRGGEQVEIVCANYLYAKALAYGMAGKATEGQGYLEHAHKIRTGGPWAEWCQSFYKSV